MLRNVLIIFLTGVSAANARQIDVNNLVPVAASGLVNSPAGSRGQTFRMGQTGTLDEITVSIGVDINEITKKDVMLELYAVDKLKFEFELLAVSQQVQLEPKLPSIFCTFEFDTQVFGKDTELAFIVIGQRVYVGFAGDDTSSGRMIMKSYDPWYPWAPPWHPPWEYQPDYDLVFATAITPVPEPSLTFGILAAGLTGMIGLHRRLLVGIVGRPTSRVHPT